VLALVQVWAAFKFGDALTLALADTDSLTHWLTDSKRQRQTETD
jgi:hypothetical protein